MEHKTTIILLDVHRDPTLWPFLCGHLIELNVVLPMIFQLQMLGACLEAYPEATRLALNAVGSRLAKVFKSEPFAEYQRIFDLLKGPDAQQRPA
jgi:hypothetical protein